MKRRTALYDCRVACGEKIVPFASYSLPVQYKTGVIKEHIVVRMQAGLFDVSHMGEVLFGGPDALKNINYILASDFTNMYDGQAHYSVMYYKDDGMVDGLIVYRYNQEKHLTVMSTANREEDVSWMKDHLNGDVVLTDISDELSQLTIQGPNTDAILRKLTEDEDIPERYYSFVLEDIMDGIKCIVSQISYTGENDYELYVNNEDAPKLRDVPPETGEAEDPIPYELGTRDTLRLEAAMPLHGHEMDATIHPLETGLKFAMKMQKDDFIGRKALEGKSVLIRRRVGLRMIGRDVAKGDEKVYASDREVGWTTSGTHYPFLGYAITMTVLDLDCTEIGTEMEVEARGRRIGAEAVALPFYKKAE